MKGSDYKNMLLFNKKDNSQIMEEVKEFSSKQNAGSLDELNAKLGEFFAQKNNAGIDSFLGLSPTQMHLVLHNPFSLSNHLFNFDCAEEWQLKEIPIIKQALFILHKLNVEGEVKGTQLGNLPKNLVIEFYHLFLSSERYARVPNREDDVLQLTRLKHLLDLAGLIKKRNKKFSLTKKGNEILAQDNYKALFEEIILTWTKNFNWGFGDGYSNLDLIQRSATFNFYMLHKLCGDWGEDDELGLCYHNAFPNLALEARDTFYGGAEREVIQCFSLRFLERYCLPLGFLEKKEEGDNYTNRKTFYKTTPFFKNNFKFHQS